MLKSKLFGKKTGFQEVEFSCTINFLNDQEPLTVAYNKDWLGCQLFNLVCSHLNLAEKEFFALRFLDNNKHRCWLDGKKLIRKQAKNVTDFEFRILHYPSDPSKLKEQLTRYLLFVQLERDLKHGRLLPSSTQLIHLSALQIQAHYEDCEIDEITLQEILNKNAHTFYHEILRQRENFRGTGAAEAERTFIYMCVQLPTYGVDPVPVRDMMGEMVFVGSNHIGIIILKDSSVTMHLPWKEVTKVDYHSKLLTIRTPKGGSTLLRLSDTNACKLLWKSLLQQQAFYTLEWSGDAKKTRSNRGIFRRSSSFRFKGMCESEVWRSVTSLNRIEPAVYRSFSRASYNIGGSQSVPPSLTTSSFNHSGSLRSTSPPISPVFLRLPPTVEDETPKFEEINKNIEAVFQQATETAAGLDVSTTAAVTTTETAVKQQAAGIVGTAVKQQAVGVVGIAVKQKTVGEHAVGKHLVREVMAGSGAQRVMKDEIGCHDDDFHSICEHSEMLKEDDAHFLAPNPSSNNFLNHRNYNGATKGGEMEEGGGDMRDDGLDMGGGVGRCDDGERNIGVFKWIEKQVYKHAILLLFIAIIYGLFSFRIIF